VSVIGFVAALVVGLAFVAAGASKIAAGPTWPATAREMGAPEFSIAFVPWIELAVGASLVTRLARPWPALAAVVLLVAFTVLIVVRLSAGQRPSCACFGAWSAQPLGRIHVVRNLILIALALLAA
jgi:uncharacterized membrane protein YphA (DoxX/SURF4 family)